MRRRTEKKNLFTLAAWQKQNGNDTSTTSCVEMLNQIESEREGMKLNISDCRYHKLLQLIETHPASSGVSTSPHIHTSAYVMRESELKSRYLPSGI
jgi:hypothetical protein